MDLSTKNTTKKYKLIEPFASDMCNGYPFVCLCHGISLNTNAIDYLTENQYIIDWYLLSSNSNAISLLYDNINQINWIELSRNTSNDPRLLELFFSVDTKDYLSWFALSSNPSSNAITLLYLHKDKIDYYSLSCNENPEVMPLLENYIVETLTTNKTFPLGFWNNLSNNEGTIKLLLEYKEYIDWDKLSTNSATEALDLLEMNIDKIKWSLLNYNTNPRAIKLLETRPEYIQWDILSGNTSDEAVALLQKNQDKIDWTYLSCNTNQTAIEMLKNNIDKVHWENISSNPEAICILEENFSFVDFAALSFNPSIFRMD